jgi:hypothetical protein
VRARRDAHHLQLGYFTQIHAKDVKPELLRNEAVMDQGMEARLLQYISSIRNEMK